METGLFAGKSRIKLAATLSPQNAKGAPMTKPANHPQRVAQDHAHHTASGRAERHAHTNIVRAPGDRVCQQSVQPDRRK
jgi:hypothetical protein